MIYLDSCALVKLILAEAESPALQSFLSAHAHHAHVTSTLARTEVRRTVRRATRDQQVHHAATAMLDQLDYVELTRQVLDNAGDIGEPRLRSLDAIHLAAAHTLDRGLTALVTYDHRLAAAARDANVVVFTPGYVD